MPEKKNQHSSYGDKLIGLFARRMFSNRCFSLTELARITDCSKQSVVRLIHDIRMAYGVDIEETVEGKQKYFRMITLKNSGSSKATPLCMDWQRVIQPGEI